MIEGFDTNLYELPDDKEFLELLSVLCESRATEEEVSRLESLLQSRPEYVERYVSYLDMHGVQYLQEAEMPALAVSSDLVIAGSIGNGAIAEGSGEVLGSGETLEPVLVKSASYASSLAKTSWSAHGLVLSLFEYPLTFSITSAASVMFCFLSALGVLQLPTGDEGPAVVEYLAEGPLAGELPIGPTREDHLLEVEAPKPVFVAKIAGGRRQHWAYGGLAMPTSLDLHEGQLLELESGQVEVLFSGGERVILEGPAKFATLSARSGYLHQGKLVAQVIDCPDGFEVQTPKVNIVDLGTEFGVEVRPADTTDVQVFQGSVEATPNRAGAKRVLLTAGLAAQFYAQAPPLIKGASEHAHQFVRPVDFATSHPRSSGLLNNWEEAESKPFVHYDVDFAGGTVGIRPQVSYPVEGGVSTALSAVRGTVLHDGYTDSSTSKTIGGNGKLVAELSEPFASVRYASGEADVLRGTGVVTVEFDLLQGSACNKNVFSISRTKKRITISRLARCSSYRVANGVYCSIRRLRSLKLKSKSAAIVIPTLSRERLFIAFTSLISVPMSSWSRSTGGRPSRRPRSPRIRAIGSLQCITPAIGIAVPS